MIISDLYQSSAKERLMSLLFKFLGNYFNRDSLISLLEKKLSDREYFEIFSKLKSENISTESPLNLIKINFNRGKKRLKDLLSLPISQVRDVSRGSQVRDVSRGSQIRDKSGSYLDVGCSDTTISLIVGQGMGFKKSNIYTTDIVEPKQGTYREEPKQKTINEVVFKLCDGERLDFPDNHFSLITLFQVLHHMVNLDKMLDELARVCQINAVVIIREHDLGFNHSLNNSLYMLEHALYEILYDNINYETFIKNYYAKYDTKNGWTEKLNSHGFKFITSKPILKFNPTNYYYAVYQYTG